ncbi:hypothetical protein BESB_004400 [Besnoitia besnoiti]|uniref:Transmembrane protein n=1 Tax=Besnoitia besnoiti TaxID=94643 RepID=A0A2A9MJK8_BESBE|nr:hypothetical protein BESB_004400 [Besnoitia besnoiti]PFH38099.1 hypothetical protein BESB_004400 [Besnoitia besnoiti]
MLGTPLILVLLFWRAAAAHGQRPEGANDDCRGRSSSPGSVLHYGISLELKSRVPDALLSSPLLSHSDSLCLSYQSFHSHHPSYFPTASIRYGHASPANTLHDDKTAYFEETEKDAFVLRDCEQYVLQGNLTLCGNLHVDGRLSVMPGVNGTAVFDSPTPYVLSRCLLHAVPRSGSLKLEGASLFVSGNVQIGGSLTATEVFLDSGAELLVGMRGTREALRATTTGQLPHSAERSSTPNSEGNFGPMSAGDVEEEVRKKRGKPINHLVFFRRTYEPMDRWVPSDQATLQAAGLAYADPNRKKPLSVEINCPLLDVFGVPATDDEAATRSTQWPLPLGPVGDVTVGKLVVSRSSQLIAFGNIRADASEIYGASRLNSVCGNYLSDTDSAGLIVRDASIVTLGGLNLSLFSNLYVRGGSYFSQTGPAQIAFDTQASAGDIYFASNLLTTSMILDNLSEAVVGGSLDAVRLVSLVEASELLVMGEFNSTALTLFDGSNARIAGRVFDANFVKLESNGFLHAAPTETAHIRSALKVAQSSTIVFDRVPLLLVEGMIEVTNSDLQVKQGGLVARSSIILNEAHLQVNGSLAATGRYFTGDEGFTQQELETEYPPTTELDEGDDPDVTDGMDIDRIDHETRPPRENSKEKSGKEGKTSPPPELEFISNSSERVDDADYHKREKAAPVVQHPAGGEEPASFSARRSMARELPDTGHQLKKHKRLDGQTRNQPTPPYPGKTELRSDNEVDEDPPLADGRAQPHAWSGAGFSTDGEDISLAEDMLSNLEETNSTRIRLPALAAVRSSILVGGQVYLNNTFTQLAARSKLTVFGKGGIRVSGGGSLQLFKGGLVEVRLGDVTVDSVLSLLVHSSLEVHRGSIYCEDLNVRTGSTLASANGDLTVSGGAEISDGAEVRVRHWMTVQRESLHVLNGSVLSAEAIGSAYGDIYCGAGSVIQSTSGEIIAQRHIIAQDRCKILARTYVLAKEGIISLENRGYVEAKDTVLAPDAGVRRTIESEIKMGRGHVNVQVMQVSPPDHLLFHPMYDSPVSPELAFDWQERQRASVNQQWIATLPNTRLGETTLSNELRRQAAARREKAFGEEWPAREQLQRPSLPPLSSESVVPGVESAEAYRPHAREGAEG